MTSSLTQQLKQLRNMKVICAGFLQTGTVSLAEALRALGYKVYGYDEHVTLHMDTWIAVMKGSKKRMNFKSMYQGIYLPINARLSLNEVNSFLLWCDMFWIGLAWPG